MACQSQGIQQPLQAEKQAAEVSKAQKRKNRRLKPKKEPRLKLNSTACRERSSGPRKLCTGSRGSSSSEVEKETQEKMTRRQNYCEQNRDEVLDNLLAFVCDIRLEIHENYPIHG